MNLRLEFGVYPRNSGGRTPQCLDVVRIHKLLYFKLGPQLDKPLLTGDWGSDVSVGAEKDELLDQNPCACHCFKIVVEAAWKEPIVDNYLAPLTTLARRFSKSRSAWNWFKKTQMEIPNWEEECSNDEKEADFDGDEDFEVGGEGLPRLNKILRLLRPVVTHWNSAYYLIKRALALKDSLVKLTNSE